MSAEPIKPRFVPPTPAHHLPPSPARAMPSPIPFQPNRSPTRPVSDSIPPPGNPRCKANCNIPWKFLKPLHHLFFVMPPGVFRDASVRAEGLQNTLDHYQHSSVGLPIGSVTVIVTALRLARYPESSPRDPVPSCAVTFSLQ